MCRSGRTTLQVGDGEGHHQVVEDVLREAQAHGGEDAAGVPAEDFDDAVALLLVRRLGLARLQEDRGIADLGADVVADDDDHGGQPEGDAPAPAEEGLVRQGGGQREQDAGGEQVAHRDGGLRPAGPESARLVRAVFGHEQHGAAPFAAERRSPGRSAGRPAGPAPSSRSAAKVGRQPIRKVATPTRTMLSCSELLAAELVAELAEDDAAERARHEADGVGDERGNDAVQLVAGVGEEHLAEHQGGRAVA